MYFMLLPAVCFADNLLVYTDLKTASSASVDENKPIVAIFSSEACVHCTNLKNNISNIPEFSKFIICVLDIDENKKLSRQYKIRSLPTSIMLDNKLIEKSRIVGFSKREYLKWLGEFKQ